MIWPSTWDLDNWQSAQAAGFCLSARLLAESTPPDKASPLALVHAVRFPRLTNHLGHGIASGGPVHCTIALHALANQVIGSLYQEFRWALANNATCTRSAIGLLQPPRITSIPWSTLLIPPIPFSSNGLANFSVCHLAAMTDPSFFVEDEWTGFTSLGAESRIRFDGVGDDNTDVSYNHLDELPNSEFPFRVERVIRFRLVRAWDNGSRYLLQSNCFQTRTAMHMLRMTVNRTTGHLAIAHNMPLLSSWSTLDAVITPFGIVESSDLQGYWTWLWKCKWSA